MKIADRTRIKKSLLLSRLDLARNKIDFRRYLDTGNHVNLWFTSDVFEVGSAGNKVNPTPKHNRKHVQPIFQH